MNLTDVYLKFDTRKKCIEYLEKIRWDGGVSCPYCGSNKQSSLSEELRYHCNKCNSSYSVTTGTIFKKSKCDLQKWFYLIMHVRDSKEKNSLRKIAEEVGVTKDTVSFMIARIKFGFQSDPELMNRIYFDIIQRSK